VNETLNYWTPRNAAPSPVLPPYRAAAGGTPAEPTDWLTMAVVVCVAAAMAFAIVIAMAWVMGR